MEYFLNLYLKYCKMYLKNIPNTCFRICYCKSTIPYIKIKFEIRIHFKLLKTTTNVEAKSIIIIN